MKAHTYRPQGVAVVAIGASTRDKSFVTAGADGSLVLRHMTSERSLIAFPATGQKVDSRPPDARRWTAIIAKQADGRLARYDISCPHPEVSWQALFGKVWYEGYGSPEYVWQSTGATDDFETKFSLVPLVFGTHQGHALRAALRHPPRGPGRALHLPVRASRRSRPRSSRRSRSWPRCPAWWSGFIAGLWLASRVERHIVPVLLMVVLLPLFGTLGVLFWDRLPRGFRARLQPGMELPLIIPLLLVGAAVALCPRPHGRGRRSSAATSASGCQTAMDLDLRPAQQPGGGPGHGLRGHPHHLHDRRGRVLERAPAPDRGLARARGQPLADRRCAWCCPPPAPASSPRS